MLAAAGVLALVIACGDGGAAPSDDPRVLELGSVAENAVNGFRGGGPDLFLQWFSAEFRDRCLPGAFEQALEEARTPASFVDLSGVKFDEGRAKVTVNLTDGAGAGYKEEWLFVEADQGGWYLDDIPAVTDCGR